MKEPLQKEIETYQRNLPNLLSEEGKFVLICGTKIEGLFSTYEDALQAGYTKCGLGPFLVKKIQAIEPINFFTRDLMLPCHT